MAKNKQNILRKTNISEMCAKCVVQKTVTFKFVITDIRNAKKKKKRNELPLYENVFTTLSVGLFFQIGVIKTRLSLIFQRYIFRSFF